VIFPALSALLASSAVRLAWFTPDLAIMTTVRCLRSSFPQKSEYVNVPANLEGELCFESASAQRRTRVTISRSILRVSLLCALLLSAVAGAAVDPANPSGSTFVLRGL